MRKIFIIQVLGNTDSADTIAKTLATAYPQEKGSDGSIIRVEFDNRRAAIAAISRLPISGTIEPGDTPISIDILTAGYRRAFQKPKPNF